MAKAALMRNPTTTVRAGARSKGLSECTLYHSFIHLFIYLFGEASQVD